MARVENSATGRINRKMLMPHACIATNSRSPDTRPNATRMPTRTAQRNRERERLRQQREQDVRDDVPLDAFFDQFLALLKNDRNFEQETEDDQDNEKGEQDLSDEIAIEQFQHGRWRTATDTRLHLMTRVAILWHMHQPFYEDLVTHEHILPWVRLHALKDYYGMVALLREFPNVRVTFNLVPSLLIQLEAFAENRARDRYLDLSLKPATELTESDIAFILENFFHAQRQRMIDVYPRYSELLARRGGTLPTAADRRSAAARFSVDDLRDLQVWQKLAWMDPIYLEHDERVGSLLRKAQHFSEEDKATLREAELELLNKVIPEYRDAAGRGQIEISTSPFYHPILPLLCDTDIYRRTHPESRMPRRPFVHPEDAFEQLMRAADCHERLFGQRPIGLWPSEGSVSDAMVPLAVRAGFRWMATDEQILERTIDVHFSRDGHGHVNQPEHLYMPYAIVSGDARIACGFRDHALSDLIGFTYAGLVVRSGGGRFHPEAGRGWPAVSAAQRWKRRCVHLRDS